LPTHPAECFSHAVYCYAARFNIGFWMGIASAFVL
jgi:hypothetical protein